MCSSDLETYQLQFESSASTLEDFLQLSPSAHSNNVWWRESRQNIDELSGSRLLRDQDTFVLPLRKDKKMSQLNFSRIRQKSRPLVPTYPEQLRLVMHLD